MTARPKGTLDTSRTILPMYVFTSQLPTLEFSQAGTDPLSVTVWAGRDKLLETTMYPVAGKLYLHDLGKLYEVATRNRLSIDSDAAFSVLGWCKMDFPYRRNCRLAREGVRGRKNYSRLNELAGRCLPVSATKTLLVFW